MSDSATKLLQTIPDAAHLTLFATRLREWLLADLSDDAAPEFTESRARALLRAAEVIDDPTLNDFHRLSEREAVQRIALCDLLAQSELADDSEVAALASTSAVAPISNPQSPIPWLAFATAAFAWKTGYPLHQLDPASPPTLYSPAGQLVKRTAHFLRQQVQRSATDRDKLARQLAHRPDADATSTLDTMQLDGPVAPLPPHFRPPIPVRYPEVARETVRVEENEAEREPPAVTQGDPITITEDDLEDEPRQPVRMPPITITEEQVRPQRQQRQQPSQQNQVRPAPLAQFANSVRNLFGSSEPMTTTKLRVVVAEHPDGPSLYGLQVQVRCKGINSFVAGATNEEGQFLCELPVRARSGLTYNVDVTWPRDLGDETERKSITLNADRTEFTLPFYVRYGGER